MAKPAKKPGMGDKKPYDYPLPKERLSYEDTPSEDLNVAERSYRNATGGGSAPAFLADRAEYEAYHLPMDLQARTQAYQRYQQARGQSPLPDIDLTPAVKATKRVAGDTAAAVKRGVGAVRKVGDTVITGAKLMKKAADKQTFINHEKLKGKQMSRAVTDPVSGRKLQKGRPVDNAPGPDHFDIAADTVKRTGAAIGAGAKKALSWTPDVKAPPKKSPLGQLGSSLDDLSDTMQGKKKLSEEKLKGKNIVWGDDSAKQKLKGPMKPKAALKAPSARKAMKTKHPTSSQGPVFPPKKKSAAPPSAPFSPAGRQPVPPLPTVGPGISYQGLAGRLPQAAAGPAQRLSGASGMGPAQRLGPRASAGPAERMSISGPVRGGRSATPRPTTPRPTGLQRPTGMSFEKLSGSCKEKAMGHGRKK